MKRVLYVDTNEVDEVRDNHENVLYKKEPSGDIEQMLALSWMWINKWTEIFGIHDWEVFVKSDENLGCKCSMKTFDSSKTVIITVGGSIEEKDIIGFLLGIAEPNVSKMPNTFKLRDMFVRAANRWG